ncbi:hypothetical protein C7B61_17455 [filamentous cyanobacterium CCP1]|nr:hypothetical protein C7B76_11160 [filamentous cyanobacterium CCP2]PSB60452.1 hypothetical protein C7B61_17455 [filamentous cyanobacterium CCP1]
MKLDSTSCQNLEQITRSSSSHTYQSKLKRLWNQFSSLVVKALTFQNDPVIHELTDRNGTTKWRVYDPITDTKIILDSSEAVLIWLEGRYSEHQQTVEGD